MTKISWAGAIVARADRSPRTTTAQAGARVCPMTGALYAGRPRPINVDGIRHADGRRPGAMPDGGRDGRPSLHDSAC